jgi:hypothetical protein
MTLDSFCEQYNERYSVWDGDEIVGGEIISATTVEDGIISLEFEDAFHGSFIGQLDIRECEWPAIEKELATTEDWEPVLCAHAGDFRTEYEKGHCDGYSDGHSEGYEWGYKQGYKACKIRSRLVRTFTRLSEMFGFKDAEPRWREILGVK